MSYRSKPSWQAELHHDGHQELQPFPLLLEELCFLLIIPIPAHLNRAVVCVTIMTQPGHKVFLANSFLHHLACVLGLLSFVLLIPYAQAGQEIHLQMLEDPNGTFSIDDVISPSKDALFRDVPNVYAGGYTRKVHWFRFTLRGEAQRSQGYIQPLFLEIQPSYLDDIQLFQPDIEHAGSFIHKRSGDTYPFSTREIPGRNFVFKVSIPDNQTQIFYVRLSTTSSSLFYVRAWNPIEYVQAQAGEYTLLGLYFGLMFATLIFVLWQGQWRREPTYRSFVAFLVSIILLMLGMNGLIGEYIAPEWPAFANFWVSAFVFIATGLAARFHRSILDIDIRQPFLNGYFVTLTWLPIVLAPVAILGYFTESVHILMICSLFAPVMGISRCFTLIRQGQVGSRLLMLANLASLAGYSYTLLGLVGITKGMVMQIYGVQIHSLIALLAFNAVLMSRFRHLQQEHQRAQKVAEQAQSAQMAAHLAQQRQGALLSMLTHELKTPLSVIRLALSRLDGDPVIQHNAKTAVIDIRDVVNRCMEADKLDQDAFPVEPAPCNVTTLLRSLRVKSSEPTRIAIDIPGVLPTVISDPLLLRTVISNLMDNALKYSPSGSPVTVQALLSSRQEDACPGILLTFTNRQGEAGLPDPIQIYERYYRSPGAHAKTGSGLGLFVARQLAERLGAALAYLPPNGDPPVRFTLWIPLNTQ